MSEGYLCLLLHCHLPFVRHPEYDQFLEENWLFEAVTETYLPLLERLQRLHREGTEYRISFSITPTLCEMLADELLQERCGRYVRARKQLMEQELERTRNTPFERVARMYYKRFEDIESSYGNRAGQALLTGLRQLQNEGVIEVLTSTATHALLPLMATQEGARAQIEQGCRNYEKHFGTRPRGIWLPECAYNNGLDELLKQSGLRYFFLESHGVLLAEPRPVYGVFSPIITPAGLAAFGRDVETSKQVWSTDEGYPGDPEYREFHRDLGYDADYDAIKPYLDPAGQRHEVGIKYHRITGDVPLEDKEPYRPKMANQKARDHAAHFVSERIKQIDQLAKVIDQYPLISSPYDAELFGHWWFEGPIFLESVLQLTDDKKKSGKTQDASLLQTVTPSEYLTKNPRHQLASPAPSTWGYEGYFDVWVNGSNDWICRHLLAAEQTMVKLANEYSSADGAQKRTLDQCARELMLAQSSDWPFLLSVGTARDYARYRVENHIGRFQSLCRALEEEDISEEHLEQIENRDNIFPEIDYRIYGSAVDRFSGES
ncbi:MAG: DUF1957 domain-containing protein [Planctomycetes bacterium]|nr:DUF1957 domain-containing protein [Planctomycetota bacterium]